MFVVATPLALGACKAHFIKRSKSSVLISLFSNSLVECRFNMLLMVSFMFSPRLYFILFLNLLQNHHKKIILIYYNMENKKARRMNMKNINVLVADDELRIRKLLSEFFQKKLGYHVVEAEDGEEA